MSRGARGKSGLRCVTVYIDDDVAQQLDQMMVSFGLDNKSQAAGVAIKAGLSAIPVETTIHEVSQASVKNIHKHEFDALAEYLEGRAKLYRASSRQL